MSARYGLGSLTYSREFPDLQNKLENLYSNYNYNSNDTNLIKCCEIIEKNANVQRKLFGSLNDIANEGPLYDCERALIRPHFTPSVCYPDYYCRSAVYDTIARKNAEIADLSFHYEKDLNCLENELTTAKIDNIQLKSELNHAKDDLVHERKRADSVHSSFESDIANLKAKLHCAEVKLACLEPRADLAEHYRQEIRILNEQIKNLRNTNHVLSEHNDFQAEIIKSRSNSPLICRTRSPSPCLRRSRSFTSVCSTRSKSPLSPNHYNQVIKQECLISRYNDMYSRDRLTAMDILRSYCSDYENNQRIVFGAIQEAFSIAKRSFLDWKIRVRSTLSTTHIGPESLEEAVQNYINRNIDLYDLPCMVSEVICALNRNPKISLPLCTSYSVISSFIREACRLAWEMSALAYPLEAAFALDSELFDDSKYRRSFDSEYSAPLVNHHIWPCLKQNCKVVVKGEACTRRGSSICTRPRTRSPFCSSRVRLRSCSPLRIY